MPHNNKLSERLYEYLSHFVLGNFWDVDVWVDNIHFYVGEHIEEEDMTLINRAVNHNGKLAITWGEIRIISDF